MATMPTPGVARPSARTAANEARVASDIAELDDLTDGKIRERWLALFEGPPPKFMRRALLQRFIAHALQVAAFGGLSRSVLHRLADIAEVERSGGIAPAETVSIKPGTRLIRVFNGITHTVTVDDDGFIWNDARHKSLSAIAKQITGTNWNGRAFFGIKRRSMRNMNAAKAKESAAPGQSTTSARPQRSRHAEASQKAEEAALG